MNAFWPDVKAKMDVEGAASKQIEVPSKVTDRDFIFMPPTEKEVESDEEWDRCGRWIFFSNDGDMDFVDKAWTDLQPLLADGTLIWLKASTAVLKHKPHLLCFTGPELSAIRRAALAIRQIVNIRGCMFYMPNEWPRMEIFDLIIHKSVCTYMHTYLGKFYKKDLSGRWWPDYEDDKKNFSLTSQFFRQNYSGFDLLPSKTETTVVSLGVNTERNPDWYLSCSYFEENDHLLPEVDRVWAVGARLLSEGRIIGLRATRARLEPECNIRGLRTNKMELFGEVRLYVDRGSDVRSQLELCDRIFKEASIQGLIYYRKLVDSGSLYSKSVPQCYRRRKIRFQERPCEEDEVMGPNEKHDYMPVPRDCTRTDRRSNIRLQERPCEEVIGPNVKHDYMPEPNEYKQTNRQSHIPFLEWLCEKEVMGANVKYDYIYTSDGELYETTKLGSVFVMSKSSSAHVHGLSAETGHVSRTDGDMSTNTRSCAVENKDKDP